MPRLSIICKEYSYYRYHMRYEIFLRSPYVVDCSPRPTTGHARTCYGNLRITQRITFRIVVSVYSCPTYELHLLQFICVMKSLCDKG